MIDRHSYGSGFGRLTLAMLVGAALFSCGGGSTPADPDDGDGGPPTPSEPPPPGPGPHFSVSPIPLDKVAAITALGENNKVLPVGHTYWSTCDRAWVFPSERPCLMERLDIRAPGPGVVWALDATEDGGITIMGPPGVYATFAHVTPRAGLEVGDSVQAGDTIARMYTEFNFDFGLIHTGLEPHEWVNMERIPEGYAYSFSPIGQFPAPLRTQMEALVYTADDPLGRLSYDVAGTAQGNWFEEGTPADISFRFDQTHRQLFLGRLQVRYATRIANARWTEPLIGLVTIDPEAPSWEEITPASGLVSLRAWNITREGTPNLDFPRGTLLVEMLSADRLRIEWFDTHEPVEAFTAGARVFER